ncbi:MAG: autotransporter-associated beta strand repeat-containing protein [Chthoniobacterales bacterium]|nr:autotransporter-associated beta strand repeat-containing protein [Chthoniobacterales bacterium]
MNTFSFLTAAALLFLAVQRQSLAGSATWSNNPSSGVWNTAANWMPSTVPNDTSDIATFGTSNMTDVINTDGIVNLDSLLFDPGAAQYTINAYYNIALYGTGIVNNSGTMQSFVAVGAFLFNNGATAGNMTHFSNVGGYVSFNDSFSAGSTTIDLSDNMYQASVVFFDSSTAANATMNVSGGAYVSLEDNATGGNATFTISGVSFLGIVENATADHASATCIGGTQYYGAGIFFQGFGSAGEGTFTAVGASSSGEKGAFLDFSGSATAASGTFVIGGGLGAGLAATTLTFFDTTTAAAANITAKGGVGGSDGGAIIFTDKAKGGTASINLNGNAELDLSTHSAPGATIGSLAGNGLVFLGARLLTIGSNNQSTTFSGVIQDTGGVAKSGIGTLTLSGANLYSGSTTVSKGVLVVANKRGSATGTGSVNVNAGTLGGKGMISGPVTIGTGTGSGAILAPSVGSKQPLTLSLTNALTLKADSTYTWQLSTKNAQADEVIAKGVTIESGAQFALQTVANKKLSTGAVFPSSATPPRVRSAAPLPTWPTVPPSPPGVML